MILDGKVTSGLAASATSRRKRVTTLPRMTVEPPLVLDRGGPVPMAVQITGQLRAAVAGSRLRAGDMAPSRWPDPRGLPSLREALCGYLRRSRGLDCTPGHILITRGVAGGLSLIAAALLRPGERAGLEEPGYPVGRAILAGR